MRRFIILTLFLLVAGCYRGLRQTYTIKAHSNKSSALSHPVDLLWQSKLKAYPNQVINLNDSLLLIGDSRGGVTTLNKNTGERGDRYWRPFKRPIQLYGLLDSVLYFSSETEKNIVAWDMKKAAQLWKKRFDVDYNQLLSIDSLLYLASDSSVAMISATLGVQFRAIQLDKKLARGIAHAKNKIYICSESGELQEFDQNLQSTDNKDLNIQMVKAILLQGERLLLYNSRGSVRIVALNNSTIEFSKDFGANLYAAPRLVNDLLIVPFATGQVSAYSLNDATQKWSFFTESLLNLDLLITNESIIIAYARGQVVSIDVKTGLERWRYDHGQSLDFAALTRQGVLLGHRKEIGFLGEKHEN